MSRWVRGPDGEHVARVTEGFDDNGLAEADARLIVAAPDLLAALEEARELMPLGTAKRAAWLRRCAAAIAKARR